VASHFYWFLIGALVVWRLTHLLYGEDGPWNLLARLRYLAGQGFWGNLMDCFYCLSLWIALPFGILLGESWKERLLLWPALSGAAILLERATAKNEEKSAFMAPEDVSEDKGEPECAVVETEHK